MVLLHEWSGWINWAKCSFFMFSGQLGIMHFVREIFDYFEAKAELKKVREECKLRMEDSHKRVHEFIKVCENQLHSTRQLLGLKEHTDEMH